MKLSTLTIPVEVVDVEITVIVSGEIGSTPFCVTKKETIDKSEPDRLAALAESLIEILPKTAVQTATEEPEIQAVPCPEYKPLPDESDTPEAVTKKTKKHQCGRHGVTHHNIGHLLEYWMNKFGVGNTELGRMIGVSDVSVCNWKNSKVPIPDSRLNQIAEALGVGTTEFLSADLNGAA